VNLSNVNKYRLGPAAIGAITGASYIFVSRTIGTMKPDIFINLIVTRVNTALLFIAAAAIFYFYTIFYSEFAKEKGEAVRIASFIMVISAFFVSLLFFKGILMVFDIYNFLSPGFNLLVPFLSSLISLYFFITLYKEILRGKRRLLPQAVLLAAFGSALAIFIRAMIVYNYFAEKKSEWFWRYTQGSPLIFIPIVVFIFFTSVYFFFICYKELKEQ